MEKKLDRSQLWRRTVALPRHLATAVLEDVESYWANVLPVMEREAAKELRKAG